MKSSKITGLLVSLCIVGCGYTSTDNELVGQPKKVHHETPIFCPNWTYVDMSLGVMKNGVGSVSTQDVFLTVEDSSLSKKLEDAIVNGNIVSLHYDERRLMFCSSDNVVRSVEIVK